MSITSIFNSYSVYAIFLTL